MLPNSYPVGLLTKGPVVAGFLSLCFSCGSYGLTCYKIDPRLRTAFAADAFFPFGSREKGSLPSVILAIGSWGSLLYTSGRATRAVTVAVGVGSFVPSACWIHFLLGRPV